MWKTKIEIRADIFARADAHEVTRLAIDDWCNETTDMANSDGETEIDPTNVELAEFGVHTETSLVDCIRKTCHK